MPCLSEVRLDVTVPEPLAARVREIAARDYSTLAATVRRLLVRGLEGEVVCREPRRVVGAAVVETN